MANDMRRAGSSAPLLTFCPGTFSAACLRCARALLGPLATLSAALRSVFAAFTIALLVSLLTITAKGQGVPATLPETMTEDSVIDFVTEQEISTVAAFIQALPPLHKRHFVAVHDSASPAADFISTSHPRIISWGADSNFVVTWTTDPEDPDSDNVEFLQPVPAEGRWIAGVIDFSGDSPEIRHPETCAQCHGDLGKPLWGADDVHDGTEGESRLDLLTEDVLALHRAMSASTHPRLTPLDLNGYQNAPRTIGFANRESQNPTWEFSLVLALRHSEVLFNRFRVRQDYDQLSGSVVCSSSLTDLERKIRSEFDQADYNIRLLSNTLEPVQGENSLTAIQAGEYKGGGVTLSLTIGFLIFHDLWQRIESVRDLYRGTSNEHALNLLRFSPREFGERFLRYPSGQATVEDELVAAYREFFELRGQASIDERALRPINPRYGAEFLGFHAAHFHDRVCSALSRNEGIIPPDPPDGGGGDDGDEDGDGENTPTNPEPAPEEEPGGSGGGGVPATLPETMTEDSVIDFVTEQEISTVAAFIQALPPLHKRHFVAVHDSASPAADFISASHPRIVSWGADASFVVTWTTNPGDPDSDNVEFLQPVPAEGRWIAGVIDFSGNSPQLRHPAACAQCHGDLRKPLWGAFDVHDGTEGESRSGTLSEDALALHQAMATSTHPRLTPLELNSYENPLRTIGFADRASQFPNWEFSVVLALRHSEVLFNRLRVRQDYDPFAESVACSSFISDLQRKIRSEFDQADYNIRLLSDTLEPVQGENLITSIKAGDYRGGSAILSTTIGFLIFHDLWQRIESVRALYRGTSNEHALDLGRFSPREFGETFLRYPVGQATVEDELVAAYHEFFELRGQASIDERALRPVNPRYGAGVPRFHAMNFHDRVCSALSRNEGAIPPDPPGPGGGGGGFGGGGGGEPRTSAPGVPSNLTAVGGDGQVVLTWEAPASDGGAEITDYEYRIDRRNPWISIGSTNTTHTVTGLVNGTAYVFEVRAVNAAGRSASSNRAEAKPEVFTLDFAHFANGDGLTSDLVFVNVGTQPIRPALYFYDQEGHLIAAESVVDITGDLEIQEDGSLSIQTAMEPLGELTISTHGQGELVSGSVRVVAFGPIGGVLRFNLPEIGVAGVGASSPVRDAVFPVRRQEAGINTGVAIHNLESSAEIVRCELMREGVLHDAVSIPLEANGQSSWFIDAAFPAADTSGFAGSVHCDAAGPGMFTAVALELDAASRIFTTLPVFPTRRAGGREAELNFAHFANGAGLTSDLVFLNLSTEQSRPAPTPFHSDILPTRPALYFYDQAGQPMAAESVVDITGDLEVMEDGGLTVQTEMEPLGVLTIATHGRGDLVSGSVRVIADEPIGGVLRFDLPGIGVAGVGASSPVRDAVFPVRRQEAGINTGVAVHNLGETAMEVTCELMQGGTVLDDASIPLAANGQSSWFIDEAFTGADTPDFVGSVRCTAPGEGMFTGVAVELDAANRIFTTLPVVPVPERMSQE